MRVLDAFMYLLAYCWSLSLKKVMTGTAIGIGLSIAPVNPLKSAFAEVTAGGGLTTLEGEALKLYTQGLRLEGPGEDLHEAQRVTSHHSSHTWTAGTSRRNLPRPSIWYS